MKSKYLYRRLSKEEANSGKIRSVINKIRIEDRATRIKHHMTYGNKRETDIISFTGSFELAQCRRSPLPKYVAIIKSDLLDQNDLIDISTRHLYLFATEEWYPCSYTIAGCLDKGSNFHKYLYSENCNEYHYFDTVPENSYIIVERIILEEIYKKSEIPKDYINSLFRPWNSPGRHEYDKVVNWSYVKEQGAVEEWQETLNILLGEYSSGSYTDMSELLNKYGVVLPTEISEIYTEFLRLFEVIDEDSFISSRKKLCEGLIDSIWSVSQIESSKRKLDFVDIVKDIPWFR